MAILSNNLSRARRTGAQAPGPYQGIAPGPFPSTVVGAQSGGSAKPGRVRRKPGASASTTRPAAFDATLATTLAKLATSANAQLAEPGLPGAWVLACRYSAPLLRGGCQYYLALSASGEPASCALLIGAPWSDVIPFYTADQQMLMELPRNMVGADATLQAHAGFLNLYGAIRKQLWADLAKLRAANPSLGGALPLLVAGIGPGAPIAQLAALDLRPGKRGNPSPATSLASYVFSCPPFADAAFAAAFASMVPAGFRVQAPAERFAAPIAGCVQAGVARTLDLRLPLDDGAWGAREEADHGGSPDDPLAAPAAAALPGFDPALACTLAQLCALTCQMVQHPGSIRAVPDSPFKLRQHLVFGGSVWASVFESPDYLVLAVRGSSTWTEQMTLVGDAALASPGWSAPGYGGYAKGLVALYATGREDLRAALNSGGDKPVLLAGQDCGGTLASLIAVDLEQNPLQGGRSVAAVYSFGAPPAADLSFASSYNGGRLAQCSFQLAGPAKSVPAFATLGALCTVGCPVPLPGPSANSEHGGASHSLAG